MLDTTDTPNTKLPEVSRRSLIGLLSACGLGVAAAPFLTSVLHAQTPPSAPAPDVAPLALPLKLTTLLGHTGTSVADVIGSATFYAKLIGGKNLAGETLPGPAKSVRYFMQLGAGSVAIGQLGTLGSVGQTKPLIDHICVGAQTYDDPAWRARLKIEGLPYIAQAVFLDYDKIAIQVSGGQGGEGLGAGAPTRLPDLYTGEPLVKSLGFDHVILRVSDVNKAVAFWNKFFGIPEVGRTGGVAWISDGKVKIGLRKVQGSEVPGVEYQAIRVEPFDTAKVTKGLKSLGATISKAMPYDKKGTIHFVGPDGIKAALVPA